MHNCTLRPPCHEHLSDARLLPQTSETGAPSTGEVRTPDVNGSTTASSSAHDDAVPGTEASADGGRPGEPSQYIQLKGVLDRELQCPVCLLMFRRACTLGCGHTFCADCLQTARRLRGDRCPVCRTDIVAVAHSVALDNVVQSLVENELDA